MNDAVDPDALWQKAKAFINRALAATDAGAFDEAGTWAASGLELLGKAALARINPLLIADPSDDGKSLLIAAGISSNVRGFKTIQAKTVFSRCARAFPTFDEREAGLIANNRNDELHSGRTPFQDLHEESWWERYWAQAAVLIAAFGETIESFVGTTRVADVEALLAKNAQNIERRVAASIERSRQHFALLVAAAAGGPLAPARPALAGSYEFEVTLPCPACESPGDLYGEHVAFGDVVIDPEDGYATEQLDVYAEEFECTYCGLHLLGPEALNAAGLPDAFHVEREIEPDWDDYGND